MTPSVLVGGAGLFLAVLITHVLIWNLFRIRQEIFWLALVFFILPWPLLFLIWNAGHLDVSSATALGILYISLAVVYVQTYPALREDIPSIRILLTVHEKRGGMTRSEIIRRLGTRDFFETKIHDLQNDALVRVRNERLHLTIMGAVLACVFYYYRKALGRDFGKG